MTFQVEVKLNAHGADTINREFQGDDSGSRWETGDTLITYREGSLSQVIGECGKLGEILRLETEGE